MGLGELILSATSTLDFGLAGSGASLVRFAGQGSHTGSLQITNFDPTTERLLFSGLTDDFDFAQDDVSFNGTPGFATVQFSGYFEVVAVPEPATILGALGLVALVGYRERKRLRGIGRSMRPLLATE